MGVLKVLIDGEDQAPAQASISVADEGLLRGDGVFEVLRVYGGRVFALDEHIERMERSATGLRLPFDRSATREDALSLAARADNANAVLRLVHTRGGRRIAMLETAPQMPDRVRLATVVYCPSGLLDGLKTLSYAANSLANRLAEERGADQALFIRPDGRVLEGPNFAVFFGFDPGEPMVTPPLKAGILDSITRRRLVALIPSVERDVDVSELGDVHEAFAASTLREVLPVSLIDDLAVTEAPGPRTQAAAEAFKACVV